MQQGSIFVRVFDRKKLDTTIKDIGNTKLFPLLLEKMSEHESTMDLDAPRDYLDFLLKEHRQGDEIGVMSLLQTLMLLYVAGGDTTAQTLRWVMGFLSRYQG